MFIGRKDDLRILNEAYESPRFEFGLLFGPRRIGKTDLLKEFALGKDALFLTAVDESLRENLRAMEREFGILSGHKYVMFEDFPSFFDAVIEYFNGRKGLIVIDEFPNLVIGRDGKRKPGAFEGILQSVIDLKLKNTSITLILSGSNVSFMKFEVGSALAPLNRRATFSFEVLPLPFEEALLFLQGREESEKTSFLSLLGFSPYGLSFIEEGKGFEENLISFFYARNANFRDVENDLMPSLNSGLYTSILRYVARGIGSNSELARALMEGENKIAVYLKTLLDEEILGKRRKFNSKKDGYYYIKNPILRFHYRFIHGRESLIRAGLGMRLYQTQKEEIPHYLTSCYEEVCLHYLLFMQKNGSLKGLYPSFDHLSIDKTELGRSVEFDGIARDEEGNCLFMESKWRNSPFGKKDLDHLYESASLTMFSKSKLKEYVVFSSSGFDLDETVKEDENLHLIDFQKMFGN